MRRPHLPVPLSGALCLCLCLCLCLREAFAWEKSFARRIPSLSRPLFALPPSLLSALPQRTWSRTPTAPVGNAAQTSTGGDEKPWKNTKPWKKAINTESRERALSIAQWQASKDLTQQLGTNNPAKELFDAIADEAIEKSSEHALLLWRNLCQISLQLRTKENVKVFLVALISRVHHCIRHQMDDRLVVLALNCAELNWLGIKYDLCAQNVLLHKVFQTYRAMKSSAVLSLTSQNLYRMLYSCYIAGDFELALELIQNNLEISDISALITSFAIIIKRNAMVDNVEGFIRFVREARVEIERKGGSINAEFIDILSSVFICLKSTAGSALIQQWSVESKSKIKNITEIESISSPSDVTSFLLSSRQNSLLVHFDKLANYIVERDLFPLDEVAMKAFNVECKRCPESSRPFYRLFAASMLALVTQSASTLSSKALRELWLQRSPHIDGSFARPLVESLIELICERLETSPKGNLGDFSTTALVAKEELIMSSQRLGTSPVSLTRFYKALALHFSWNGLEWKPKELIRVVMACIHTGQYTDAIEILQNLSLIHRGDARYVLLSSLCLFIDRDAPTIIPELPAFVIRAHDLLLTHEVLISRELMIVLLKAICIHGTREDCLQVVEWMKSRSWPLESDAYELLLRKSISTKNAEWTKALFAEAENQRVWISSETVENAHKGFESMNDQEGLQQLSKFKFQMNTS